LFFLNFCSIAIYGVATMNSGVERGITGQRINSWSVCLTRAQCYHRDGYQFFGTCKDVSITCRAAAIYEYSSE